MGNFGEDLRMERLSRGIALEEISSVTKISQRHLMALEQEHFRQLPGGILSKGIVRGYAGAVGLDEDDWIERFLKASRASGEMAENERDWTAFASNVGKARMMHRDAVELRFRWVGALLLLAAVAGASYFAIRYYGLRAGLWQHLMPMQQIHSGANSALGHVHAMMGHIGDRIHTVFKH